MAKKYLLLVDESEEADRALSLAARRALRFDYGIVLLACINPDDYTGTHLFGVGERMRRESFNRAQELLDRAIKRLTRFGVMTTETKLFEGKTSDAVLKIISEDKEIFSLVLAAGTGTDGSGPLVTGLAKTAGHFPVPILIVPGRLTDEEIEALA